MSIYPGIWAINTITAVGDSNSVVVRRSNISRLLMYELLVQLFAVTTVFNIVSGHGTFSIVTPLRKYHHMHCFEYQLQFFCCYFQGGHARPTRSLVCNRWVHKHYSQLQVRSHLLQLYGLENCRPHPML